MVPNSMFWESFGFLFAKDLLMLCVLFGEFCFRGFYVPDDSPEVGFCCI